MEVPVKAAWGDGRSFVKTFWRALFSVRVSQPGQIYGVWGVMVILGGIAYQRRVPIEDRCLECGQTSILLIVYGSDVHLVEYRLQLDR